MAEQTIGILMYNVAINVNMEQVAEAEVKTSKFAESIKKLKANAAEAAIELAMSLPGAIIGIGVAAQTAASNFEKAMSDVQGATAATKAQMEETSGIAKNLYNQNFGKDWADLGNAIVAVKTVTGQTGDQLENTTRNAILLQDSFGFKLTDSVKTADTMMRQFGISSEQAMNLLAQGSQQGLNKSGDLLDSANKYSNQFKALGFTAEGMFDVLSAGAIEGAYQLDKVGLAVKDFNSIAKDNSKSTRGAFKELGFDANAMTKTFAEGGSKASQAFSQVIKGIAAIEDPVKRNKIGVALMGAQFKELEADVVTAMGNATDKFDETAASMNELNQIKFNKPGEAFAMFGRQIETGFLMPIGQKMLPHLSKLGQWLVDHKPQIEAVGTAVANFLGKGFNVVAGAIPALISGFNAFTGFIAENKNAILATTAVLTTIFLPALIRTGVQAAISGAKMSGSFLKGIILTGVESVKTAAKMTGSLIVSIYKYAASGWVAVGSIIRMTAAWIASKVPLVTHKALLLAVNAELVALKARLVLSTIAAKAKTAALRIMTFTTTTASAAMRVMTIGTWLSTAGTWAMTAAQWALNSAFWANPITWIVAGIIAVIIAAILIFKNWGTIGPWLLAQWTVFKNGFFNIFNSIVTFVSGWGLLIITAIVGAISWIVTTVTGYWTQITTITTNVFNGIVTFFSGWVLLIHTAIVGAISWIVTVITGYWTQISTITTNVFSGIGTFFTGIWTTITGFFQGIDLQEIGRNIIQGLIDGIVNMAGAVVTAITNVAGKITTGIKNFLGIKSPSRVMMEVGYYTGEGLADGITGTQAMVSVASTALAGEVIAPYAQTALAGEVTAPYVQTALAGEVTASYVQNALASEATASYAQTALLSDATASYTQTALAGEVTAPLSDPAQKVSATTYTPESAPVRANTTQRLEIDLNIDMKGSTSGGSVNSDMAEQMKRVIQDAVDSAIRRMGLLEVEV
ncbi:phage tail tape measure protein [Paenibacillus sp. GSMTC-2017]|nr:phage tail tape measure protein [Paenibacillus sp. GSMTC-2017]